MKCQNKDCEKEVEYCDKYIITGLTVNIDTDEICENIFTLCPACYWEVIHKLQGCYKGA